MRNGAVAPASGGEPRQEVDREGEAVGWRVRVGVERAEDHEGAIADELVDHASVPARRRRYGGAEAVE